MKPLTFALLRRLSDGTFHSGEEMARELGISRATVSNALAEIKDWDVDLARISGRGYRLERPIEWIDAARLAEAFPELNPEVFDVVDSTNTVCFRGADEGRAHRRLVVAELQTGGRGRRGRVWRATLGGSLLFSVLWRFDQPAVALSGLSLAVGVALSRALKAAGIAGAALKWPNDVLYQYRKLAGILIELQGDALGPTTAVIGIGLNVRLSARTRDAIDQAVIDLATIVGHVPSRNALLHQVLRHLGAVLREFEANGFGGLREEWLAEHAYQGKPVRLVLPGGDVLPGRVEGITEDGALLLLRGRELLRVNAGEMTLRAATDASR